MGLVKPKKKPKIKKGDFHLVVNDEIETVKIYDHTGAIVKADKHPARGSLSSLPALAKGWNGRTTWRNGGDTPPGLYLLGEFFKTKEWEDAGIWNSYGALCWDMISLEGQENVRGRAGICLHGGGSAARPHPMAAYQSLEKTSGCVRMHNQDLEDYILPLSHYWSDQHAWYKRDNNVYISVYQDYD